ncbi:syringomycin synthetase domain protein [Mycobacterium xenopi 3993]|nr:syringomycin synthetase domain protein [Mycobacterium xenopi 3993]
MGVLDKQRRPPGERRACRRQGYRLPATVLGQAMFMSSSRIRHDTPSTARW